MQIRKRFKNLLGFVITSLYVIAGSYLFPYIENRALSSAPISTHDINKTTLLLQELKINYSCLHNVSDTGLRNLATAVLDATAHFVPPKSSQKWTTGDGFQLTFEMLSTVGYGSRPPTTTTGRVCAIFYVLVGIPMYLYTLRILGQIINFAFTKAIWLIETRCFQRQEAKHVKFKSLIASAVTLPVFILSAAVMLSKNNNWSYIDSVYALVMTFTTVGFGDFVIRHSAKVVILTGLCLMSALLDAAVSYLGKLAEEEQHTEGNSCRLCCLRRRVCSTREENEEGHGMENY